MCNNIFIFLHCVLKPLVKINPKSILDLFPEKWYVHDGRSRLYLYNMNTEHTRRLAEANVLSRKRTLSRVCYDKSYHSATSDLSSIRAWLCSVRHLVVNKLFIDLLHEVWLRGPLFLCTVYMYVVHSSLNPSPSQWGRVHCCAKCSWRCCNELHRPWTWLHCTVYSSLSLTGSYVAIPYYVATPPSGSKYWIERMMTALLWLYYLLVRPFPLRKYTIEVVVILRYRASNYPLILP